MDELMEEEEVDTGYHLNPDAATAAGAEHRRWIIMGQAISNGQANGTGHGRWAVGRGDVGDRQACVLPSSTLYGVACAKQQIRCKIVSV